MNKVFLDTDIILDFLGDRKPFSRYAVSIFSQAYQKHLRLFTSSNSITIAYYILRKMIGDKKSRESISSLLKYISVIPVTERILIQALSSDFKDFEDAVQHFAALSLADIRIIVTRNLKDFSRSALPVKSPEEFLFNQ